ncbi:tRNA threonylcarbamoyladenosine biosynthesis protein TsaB [Marinospirillum celere]|uniref:tRNA threonylcarbamoyladenosine biosynthesis protein TsaB n=1 Tax=Marinospirillum celere TaxID=1122252 RepID=A0A1I1H4T7_9GAMM|nr:tRNA (adenosine(37)-N6)-threonylcarbamoyltransferase complex dimerization subunit type 1 TsaB [Marinospirillum celere]SFC16170.1 tRNA threonylcarbamoyladenosine biosynthesis protein TsaB [Marinospirillum celere]
MSKILALDTSSDACSVALWNEGTVTADFQMLPRQHAQALLPQLGQLLADSGVRLEELDALAFGRGPGSFTGLRIAAATAQGLALARDLPLLPLSTLQALALSAQKKYFARKILTLLDARMDEVYWCAWQAGSGAPQALIEESLAKPEAVLPPELGEDWLLVGSGAVYSDRLPPVLRSQIQQEIPELYPDAAALVYLAAEAWEAGQAVDAAEGQPIYLRDQVTG